MTSPPPVNDTRTAGPGTLALFAVATVAIFGLWYATGGTADDRAELTIAITTDHATPAQDLSSHRIERLVADDVSVREAVATGLHRTDEAVRQRLELLGLAALTRELGDPEAAERWLDDQVSAQIDCGAARIEPTRD